MRIHGLGIDSPDKFVDGRSLIETPRQAQELGCQAAELSIASLNVIMYGELIAERVAAIQAARVSTDV